MSVHVGKAHNKYTHEKKCVVEKCEFQSNDKTQLQHHMTKTHMDIIVDPSDPVPINECEYRSQQFRTKKRLNTHIVTHETWKGNIIKTPATKVKCNMCEFRAPSRTVLMYHKKSHMTKLSPKAVQAERLLKESAELSVQIMN